MSIMRCEKHERNWDSDKLDECPLCENEHEESLGPDAMPELRGLLNFIEHGCDARPEDKHDALQDIEALRAYALRAREDAERYRWLRTRMTYRDIDAGSTALSIIVRQWYHETHDRASDTLDAAIDAARSKDARGEK